MDDKLIQLEKQVIEMVKTVGDDILWISIDQYGARIQLTNESKFAEVGSFYKYEIDTSGDDFIHTKIKKSVKYVIVSESADKIDNTKYDTQRGV